jgi:ornithine carbamoyltransferase
LSIQSNLGIVLVVKTMAKHFLSINDVTKEEIISLLDRASELKKDLKAGKDQTNLLKGKTLGMIFDKPSLRTRVSFEAGMFQLGGHAMVLSTSEIGIGQRESRADVARVMSRYLNAVMIRTFGHEILEETAEYSTVPVINGLSDLEHPCQTLADLLTVKEHFGTLDGLKIAYIGDGNNTVRSLMLACGKLGVKIHIACPLGFEPGKEFESKFSTVCHSVGEAAQDADVIYTDVWSSMGQEKEAQKRKKIFAGYQINKALLEEYPKKSAIVLHCLPAHRGEEITAEALENHEATILNQAENRLHTQKAVLLSLIN